ncbi:MAG: hypothetical protein NVSMB1_14920 [Polyangiales bacterium]
MRLKIILPNAIVVLLVGLLSYFVVRQKLMTLDDPTSVKQSAERNALGAAGLVQLRLLRAERWLAEQPHDTLRDSLQNIPFETATRREKTTEALDSVKRHAAEDRSVFASPPDFAALVDKNGHAAGWSNDQQTYHGEAFGDEYKPLLAAIADNRTGSDVWLGTRFAHKHLVSYAPVRDKDGHAIGAMVLAWNLSNQNISELSDAATALLVLEGGSPKVKATANEDQAPGFAAEVEGSGKDSVLRALKKGQDSIMTPGGNAVGVAALRNVGDGTSAAIATGRRAVSISSPDQLLWPILAATVLGLVFVLIAGTLLGQYITEPVGTMEESLLQVINGNTNNRVQIEHAELGGLAFRINQLLNTVLGVEEDNTDEEGRPSIAPAPNHFQEAMSVDDRVTDAGTAAALGAEPESAYYARLYREYIDARRAVGEGVEGITHEVFVNRIKGMESKELKEAGRPVRYVVQARDKQVVLLKVPIG